MLSFREYIEESKKPDPKKYPGFSHRPNWKDRKGKVKKSLARMDKEEKDKKYGKGRDEWEETDEDELRRREIELDLPQGFDQSRLRER